MGQASSLTAVSHTSRQTLGEFERLVLPYPSSTTSSSSSAFGIASGT